MANAASATAKGGDQNNARQNHNPTPSAPNPMADGKVSVPFSFFLGYDRGPNGEMVVNEEQAKTVRLITLHVSP